MIKNADIATGNTYASTDVTTSNNYKQQHLFIGKVGVLIEFTLVVLFTLEFTILRMTSYLPGIICKVNTVKKKYR